MISVPPWVLAAVVLLASNMITCHGISHDAKGEKENEEKGTLVAFGLLATIAGLVILWITPEPEPLSAWIGIVATAPCSWIAMRSASKGMQATGAAILATGVLMAVTLIIRASLPGFD